MSATQYFPIPPEMLALACETVTRQVSRLPFLRSGVMVTGELLGVTLESLNAEVTRSLALTTPRDSPEGLAEGLDRILEQRLRVEGKTTVPVISEVLASAGITEPTEILDRHLHRPRRAIRLRSQWTWHIASAMTPQMKLAGTGSENTSSLSWMSICPVCRTGVLNRVVGKQLFGLPHTDFIIECSHCGAKFIPVGTAFRLVSIATIRDPLWKKHLDKTYHADEWAALARGTSPGGNPLLRPDAKKPAGSAISLPSGSLPLMKDGSLSIPVAGKTLYFKPVGISFSGGLKEGTFSRMQTPLEEILLDPAFCHLRDPVLAKYSRYLPLKIGLFLSQLKERHDVFYREFLNPYGDEKYSMIRAEEAHDSGKSGVLLVIVNRSIYHTVDCPQSFRTTINETFGRIIPEHCYLNGDEIRCRINAVLSNNRKEAGLFMHVSENKEERERITGLLLRKDSGNIPKNSS
jgi:hypothetical protein